MKDRRKWFLCGFERLRSYQDENETRNWEEIPFSYCENSTKDPFNIDSHPQEDTLFDQIIAHASIKLGKNLLEGVLTVF